MNFQPAAVGSVLPEDAFLSERIGINHKFTIPANIRKCEETGRIRAFDLVWKKGMPFEPHVYWDSDVAKVIEGMAYDRMLNPDPEREKELERYVEKIISAQQPDGYLNTHYTQVEPEKRWSCLHYNHELYCAGHLIEAAVAHFKATGKRNFLSAVCRFADYIATVFGRGPGQIPGYPGHEEIELALCKLYDVTGEKKYLDLAKYFIDERGRAPLFFDEEDKRNNYPPEDCSGVQAHQPVREQTEAVGHAVRSMYLCCGMADVASRTGDAELFSVCEKLWNSVVNHKMYLTGAIGSRARGEAFGSDGCLPNDTAYAESCAAIGLALFAERMLNITGDGKYAEELERVLYNAVPGGISLDGEHFFYVNRMAFDPTMTVSDSRTDAFPERSAWFGCSCCPTNFCRFFPQTGSFLCSVSENAVRINIPAAMRGEIPLANGTFSFRIESDYPASGKIRVKILRGAGTSELALRIPAWCREWSFSCPGVSGKPQVHSGYVSITREWKDGDEILLDLNMPVRIIRANTEVSADSGRIALMRGPVVYALESVDTPSLRFRELLVPAAQKFETVTVSGIPGSLPALRGTAYVERSVSGVLYSEEVPVVEGPVSITAIPYAFWENRGAVSEFIVWMREKR